MSCSTPTLVHIKTEDGFLIAAHVFNPTDSAIKVLSSVVISNATGVKAIFYHKFAKWLCSKGVGVITYDYRYSGLSFPPHLLEPIERAASEKDEDKELEAYRLALKQAPEDVELSTTWSQLDLAAVTIYASLLWREVDLTLMGNSLGGHLNTLLDINTILGTDLIESLPASIGDTYSSSSRPQRVTRLLNICGGNAYWKNNNNPEGARFAFKELIHKPLLEDGIFYATNLGLGWDLPKSCGLEWLEWFFSPLFSLTRKANARNAREVTQACPLLYVGFEDDETITKNMMEKYLTLVCHPNSDVKSLWIDPSKETPIWPKCGHVNSFSPSGIQEEVNEESSTSKRKGKAAIRGGELYEPSSNQQGNEEEDEEIELTREETIWKVYLAYILNGEVIDVGEMRKWGAEQRRNHETLFRIYEKEKKEEEERERFGDGGNEDDEDEDGLRSKL